MPLKSSVAEDKLLDGSTKCHVTNKHDSLFLQVLKTNDGVGMRLSAKCGLDYFLVRGAGKIGASNTKINANISCWNLHSYAKIETNSSYS